MKKISVMGAVALVMVLAFAICACSGSNETAEPDTSKPTEPLQATQVPVSTPTPEPTATSTPTPTPEPTPTPTTVPTPLPIKQFDIPDCEALNFTRNIKAGWNLGNAFDASDCNWVSGDLAYESAWCGAKTTEELIDAIKDMGFNAVRIPVSYHNHVSDDGKYTISPEWLDRINEVVDWCIDRDMYVIMNIHHDNSKDFMYPTSEYLDQSVDYVTKIWKQVASRYKDYGEKLIFECMNEPRMVGHNNEWWIDNNNADCIDAINCINSINQAFVDTVRATGGNNKTRYLLVPGYDGSADGALHPNFVLPTDPAETNDNHILVEVHAYTPYDFALENPGINTWSSSKQLDVSNTAGFMNKLYDKFIANGIGVIIDEYGCLDKKNTEARTDFAGYYVKLASKRGMPCFVWDNNAVNSNGENFGLIDRKTSGWIFPEVAEAIIDNAWAD